MPREAVHHRRHVKTRRHLRQRPADEIDDELPAVLVFGFGLTRHAALADARGGDAADVGRRMRLVVLPIELVRHVELVAGFDRPLGRPKGDDVVVNLVLRRNFDELHRARAPIPKRLDPHARPPVVEGAVVLIVGEIAVALHQSEGFRVLVEERIGQHRRRIDQRPPDALAFAGPQRQPVAIVDFRTPVGGIAPLILAVPVHAGERRDAQLRDVGPEEEFGAHLHDRAALLCGIELIGAGQAGAVEQRVNRDRRMAGLRLRQPELDETGKLLLGRRRDGIDGNAAGRAAVLIVLSRAAEVACALERQPIGDGLRPVHDAKTRKAEVLRQFFGQAGGAILEILWRIDHPPRRTAGQDIDLHRQRVEFVDVE